MALRGQFSYGGSMKTRLTILILAITASCAMVLAATLSPKKLLVQLEAKPSVTCFPASALQYPELRQDFSKACSDCEAWAGKETESNFLVVVEDPEYSWVLTIYDCEGQLIERLHWSGALTLGLDKAVDIMHQLTAD